MNISNAYYTCYVYSHKNIGNENKTFTFISI